MTVVRAAKVFCKIIVTLSALFLFWFAVSFALYRIPSGAPVEVFAGNVHFKMVELDLSNRGYFESIMPARSVVRIQGAPALYVSESDLKKLWVENPLEMEYKGYTLRAKILAPPLLFGGYGLCKVVGVERVTGVPPDISK